VLTADVQTFGQEAEVVRRLDQPLILLAEALHLQVAGGQSFFAGAGTIVRI
jgi:hypothetical protein